MVAAAADLIVLNGRGVTNLPWLFRVADRTQAVLRQVGRAARRSGRRGRRWASLSPRFHGCRHACAPRLRPLASPA
jgi:hypothetical protein